MRSGATSLRRGWPLRRSLGVVGVLLVVGLLCAWVLLASPWMRVQRVEVVGATGAQASAVQAVADRERGAPLLQVDGSRVRSEVGAIPFVSRVDVIRDWPDRLTVSVVVRSPMVALKKPQQGVELVDVEGVRYAESDAPPAGVPEATLAHPGEAAELAAAARVMGDLDADQRARVRSVKVDSPDAVSFVIDGVTVIWGGPVDGHQKAVVMAALLQQKDVRTVNVSAPGSPVAS